MLELGGKKPFYLAAGVHTFSTAGLGIMLPFLRQVVFRHPWTQEQSCSKEHHCRVDRSSIVRSVRELHCSDDILPILARLELPLSVNTPAILQLSPLH